MHISMLAAVFCCSVAIILRSSQNTPIDGKDMWKDTVIVFSALFGLIFAGITMVKAWFGYGEMCGDNDQSYDSLESGDGIPFAQVAETKAHEHERSMSARVASSRRNESAMHSARPESTKSYRDEDDIVCGIDLEVTRAPFESHSVKHPAGTFRIVGLHRDGVCERQGACVVGDVLATVDGKKLSGMRLEQVEFFLLQPYRNFFHASPSHGMRYLFAEARLRQASDDVVFRFFLLQVEALLTGKAGTSIILGLYTDQVRDEKHWPLINSRVCARARAHARAFHLIFLTLRLLLTDGMFTSLSLVCSRGSLSADMSCSLPRLLQSEHPRGAQHAQERAAAARLCSPNLAGIRRRTEIDRCF